MSFSGRIFINSGINSSRGLVFDKNGNLYCANANNTISKITSGGSVSIFASGLSGIYDLAFDKKENLYVSNLGNNTISKITPSGSVSVFASVNGGPIGLAFDKSDNLYVASNGINTIFKITPSGSISTFATGLTGPYGLSFYRDYLYCSNKVGNTISKITLNGIVTKFANVTNPQFLTFDKNGNLYTGNDNKLIKIRLNGIVKELTITGTTLDDVEGLAFDNKGNLFAVNSDISNIIKISLNATGILPFPLIKKKVNTISSKNEVLVTIQTLNPEDKNSTTLQSLILRYQNDRDALMEIEKAFGVSIVDHHC
tara:strand:- start:20 stop:955 length:936 start_codon:yes stop_codon:yes gene_type:complete